MQAVRLLDENAIIEAIAAHLLQRGYKIIGHCTTSQQGVDLEALDAQGKGWLIEAKGETSSRTSSPNFGKPFDDSQVTVHVSRAFYQAACLKGKYPECGIALAFPNEKRHQKRISEISEALAKLEIKVFWVNRDGTVS